MEVIKVLVVDDNKRIVTILKEALERETEQHLTERRHFTRYRHCVRMSFCWI